MPISEDNVARLVPTRTGLPLAAALVGFTPDLVLHSVAFTGGVATFLRRQGRILLMSEPTNAPYPIRPEVIQIGPAPDAATSGRSTYTAPLLYMPDAKFEA
jgi:hypothetical protein